MRLFEHEFALFEKIQQELEVADAIKKIQHDKINHSDLFKFVLLTNSGCMVADDVTVRELTRALEKLKHINL